MRQKVDIHNLKYESSLNTFYGHFTTCPYMAGNLYVLGKRKTVAFVRLDHIQFDFESIQSKLQEKVNLIFKNIYCWQSIKESDQYFILIYEMSL